MKPLTQEDALLLETLREAGREAVERKRRLGQYAVIWRDGAPAFIGPNPPAASCQCPPVPEEARHMGVGKPGESRQG